MPDNGTVRRARCGESRTPGSEGGPGKPTGSDPGKAPRSDPARVCVRTRPYHSVRGRSLTGRVWSLWESSRAAAPAMAATSYGKDRKGDYLETLADVSESAGMTRHGEGDGNALHRRSSDPRWPRVMRRRPARAWRSVDRGTCRPGY